VTSHLHIILRFSMSGAILPFPHTSSWSDAYLRTKVPLSVLWGLVQNFTLVKTYRYGRSCPRFGQVITTAL
jgi:hypothetical protein